MDITNKDEMKTERRILKLSNITEKRLIRSISSLIIFLSFWNITKIEIIRHLKSLRLIRRDRDYNEKSTFSKKN